VAREVEKIRWQLSSGVQTPTKMRPLEEGPFIGNSPTLRAGRNDVGEEHEMFRPPTARVKSSWRSEAAESGLKRSPKDQSDVDGKRQNIFQSMVPNPFEDARGREGKNRGRTPHAKATLNCLRGAAWKIEPYRNGSSFSETATNFQLDNTC